MKKSSAFTIAEVLISLTIIGLLAVLVIPTRVMGTKAKAYNTLYKTVYKQIQDGLVEASNIQKQSFVYVGDGSSNNSKYSLDDYMKHHFEARNISTVWQPASGTAVSYTYTGITGVSATDFSTMSKAYKLKNGTTLLFPSASIKVMTQAGCTQTNPCPAYIDVNGPDEPNSIVACENGTTTSTDLTVACKIDPNSNFDMFPIAIKKDHIYPATNASDFILNK